MSVYIMNTVKSNPVKATLNGQQVTVYRRRFACMANDLDCLGWTESRGRNKALIQARLERVRSAWGIMCPEWVVDEGEGGEVEGRPVYMDRRIIGDDITDGKHMGTLRRNPNGRGWVVVPPPAVPECK